MDYWNEYKGSDPYIYICKYVRSNGKRCCNSTFSHILTNNYNNQYITDEYYKYSCIL